jgi:hypothetical protein
MFSFRLILVSVVLYCPRPKAAEVEAAAAPKDVI